MYDICILFLIIKICVEYTCIQTYVYININGCNLSIYIVLYMCPIRVRHDSFIVDIVGYPRVIKRKNNMFALEGNMT